MPTMTLVQAVTAWKLARAFGHEWGNVLDLHEIKLDPEQVRAAVRTRSDSLWAGIDAPRVDESGTHQHTTATRRVEWAVYANGNVFVWISRPSGEVIRAHVVRADDFDLRDALEMEIDIEVLGPCGERHWAALEDVLWQVAGPAARVAVSAAERSDAGVRAAAELELAEVEAESAAWERHAADTEQNAEAERLRLSRAVEAAAEAAESLALARAALA